MRVDLGDDPAVVLIASRLDIDEDAVVGKLHRLWCWADKHTTDGTAPAITARWVDRYVNQPGFANAMEAARWISFNEDGVVFPEFDRHNGESAKRRVEATLRKRLSRENRDKGETGEGRTSIPRPFVRHVMQRDGYQCVFCGTESDEKTESSRRAILSIDHLIPESRGGSAAIENLACTCRSCNNEKNDRTPEEWGILPTFLNDGVSYEGHKLVSTMSQEMRDTSVTREEKRREEKENPSDDLFDEFWAAYPRKDSKADARKAFGKLKVSAEFLPTILTGLARAKKTDQWIKDDGQFVPYAATWLNKRRWEDGQEAKAESEWWAAAGFEKEWQATNAGCTKVNAYQWRDGQRIKEDA